MGIPTSIYYLPRRAHIFWTAFIVYGQLKWTEILNKVLRRSSEAKAEAWKHSNTEAAKKILRTSTRRRGLWIKCCQYIAARSDALPAVYSEVLSKSLDDCPPTPSRHVLNLVNTELTSSQAGQTYLETNGRKELTVNDLFDDFNPDKPIASASIAQVHVAVEKATGRKVVLKVQHPNVKSMLLQDLIDLKTLLRLIAGAEPKFDMRPVLDAWIEMVPFETDFIHECKNLENVKQALENSQNIEHLSSISYVPEPLKNYSTDKLFVMEYIEGYKISEVVSGKHSNSERFKNINKVKVVDEISRSFGIQLFLCNTFSGDPHPGNFLIRDNGQPILLDFGICVNVTNDLRLGFAKLIVAAYNSDSYSLVQALGDIGVKLNRADPKASLDVIKYLFRTTAPTDESLKQQKDFANGMDKRKDEIKKNELENPVISSGSDDGNDSDKIVNEESRTPLDSFPGHLVFFFRSLGMLRGLATSLDVRHSYLEALCPYAEYALLNECAVENRLKSPIYGPIYSKGDKANRVVSMLMNVIPKLYKSKMMIGLQVSVYKNDECILNLNAGRIGEYNERPIEPNTLFNSFSTTKGLTSILFAYIQDKYNVEYEDLVIKYWPEYGQNGKDSTTISHILSHTAGLARSLPDELSMVRLRDDWVGIIKHFEMAKPSQKPGEKMEYHAISFGWIVAGLIMKITGGTTYQDILSELTSKLGIEDECYCGNLPNELLPDSVDNTRIARLSSYFMQDLEKDGALHDVVRKHTAEDKNEEEQGSKDFVDGMKDNEKTMNGIMENMNMSSLDDEIKIPLYLLDLNFYNHPILRASCIPSANGHFSSNALAKLYSLIANNGKSGNQQIIPEQRIQKLKKRIREFEYKGRRAWAAGLTLYDGIDPITGHKVKDAIIGHGGVGGSMAFAIPDSGISIAVVVNKLNVLSVAAGAVIAIVCGGLDVPVPESYYAFSRHIMKGVNDGGIEQVGVDNGEDNLFERMFEGASQDDVMKILIG